MVDLNELRNALETFAEIDNEMQLPTMLTFLFVASRGSCTQKEIEETLKFTNAGASRNVSYWTIRRFDKRPGIGFFNRQEDDNDRRYKLISLTPKGQAFYARLTGERHGKTARKSVDS